MQTVSYKWSTSNSRQHSFSYLHFFSYSKTKFTVIQYLNIRNIKPIELSRHKDNIRCCQTWNKPTQTKPLAHVHTIKRILNVHIYANLLYSINFMSTVFHQFNSFSHKNSLVEKTKIQANRTSKPELKYTITEKNERRLIHYTCDHYEYNIPVWKFHNSSHLLFPILLVSVLTTNSFIIWSHVTFIFTGNTKKAKRVNSPKHIVHSHMKYCFL